MKKFTIMALAVCLTVVMAAPVMAVDVDFGGTYRTRGFYTSHWDLRDTSASNSYMDMRFRLQTTFKVNDILSVTTRFDALEKEWGNGDDSTADPTGAIDNKDIDFERAYMTIKTDIGDLHIGRMAAGTWGTSFLDSGTSADRIKFVKKIDNLTLYAIFQKNTEADMATGAGDAADQDSDTYYLLGKYKMENVTSGLLLAFNNNKTVATQTTRKYVAMPYFVSTFGPLEVQGELAYNFGETEYDAGGTDRDIKELAYNLEATYSFGPASVMAGYAFVSGDDGSDPNEDTAYGHVGADWEKLFILTYDESPVNALGGFGNLSQASNYGAKIFYGGANFSPLDNLELGFVVGMADADETQFPNQEDDFGVEYDFTLNWKIYDNLSYTAIAAFLSAGDIWKGGVATAEVEDTLALYHQIQLSF